MSNPSYRYCPNCATPLIEKLIAERRRPACPACGFVHYEDPKVVALVVVEHEGRLLLGRRNIEPGRGKWSFCSGYVNRGEQVEEAARREVKEETNLDVRLAGLLGVYSREGSPHILVGFRATVAREGVDLMRAQADEVIELAFFAPEEMPELAFPGDRQVFGDWLKRRESDAAF